MAASTAHEHPIKLRTLKVYRVLRDAAACRKGCLSAGATCRGDDASDLHDEPFQAQQQQMIMNAAGSTGRRSRPSHRDPRRYRACMRSLCRCSWWQGMHHELQCVCVCGIVCGFVLTGSKFDSCHFCLNSFSAENPNRDFHIDFGDKN